ncbi:uncharacterized protein LOC126892707 [Diabrotica virgifera virgifera]|uniref:Uncharacterized protein n=1 Tax=Diabrotica virgifera virgifera TaxID=50390 RepID=A0ABM5L787_DIAVI|nr:uncharacterized protein LOC126892707 [Diabrotica virgifera virgifera]
MLKNFKFLFFFQNYLSKHSDPQSQALLENVNSKYYYYTRTKGLFRICYPKERPPTVKTYLSPLETHCNNVNYYIPDENNDTKDFTDDAWTRLHMGRSMIALFIISFIAVFAAFCTGVTGCWKRSPGNITATAILMLLASCTVDSSNPSISSSLSDSNSFDADDHQEEFIAPLSTVTVQPSTSQILRHFTSMASMLIPLQ